MQTLALQHGDLVVSDGGYMMHSGVARIRQDLTLALTEEYGSDRFHPGWGSILGSFVGGIIDPESQQLVRAEVNRVLQNYLILQQNEVLRDTVVDVQGRYNTSDVVRSVDDIQVKALYDTIYLAAKLTTLSRETVTISRAVS